MWIGMKEKRIQFICLTLSHMLKKITVSICFAQIYFYKKLLCKTVTALMQKPISTCPHLWFFSAIHIIHWQLGQLELWRTEIKYPEQKCEVILVILAWWPDLVSATSHIRYKTHCGPKTILPKTLNNNEQYKPNKKLLHSMQIMKNWSISKWINIVW